MKGGIYSDERCPVCGGKFRHYEPRGVWCPKHPECQPARYVVRFGDITKRFRGYDDASRFLTGLRFKTDEGSFDRRDYRKDQPLGFANLAAKWLRYRKGEVRCYNNLQCHMQRASAYFCNTNIKHIGYGDLEDYLHKLQGTDLSSKTVANYMTTLHAFFAWCHKREGVEPPEFPAVKVELGWRNTVGKGTQQAIIEEVKRISWDANPKIWVGIKWLATYYEVRPGELIRVKEKDFNYETGTLFIRHTKTGEGRIVYFLPEDIALARSFGPAFPQLHFFRHEKGHRGAKPGRRFGKDYIYRWWKTACGNLGVKGVDLYGGTRHSTVRHLREQYSPEEIMQGGWNTNKAFARYLGPVQQEQKREMYRVSGRVRMSKQQKEVSP